MIVNVMVINAQISNAEEFYNHAKNCEALQTYILSSFCIVRNNEGFRIRVEFSDPDSGNSISYYSLPIGHMLEALQQFASYYARLMDLKIIISLDVVRIFCYDTNEK